MKTNQNQTFEPTTYNVLKFSTKFLITALNSIEPTTYNVLKLLNSDEIEQLLLQLNQQHIMY